jgi:hypothetical protein
MAQPPVKPSANPPPRSTGQPTVRAPAHQIPAGNRAPDHPLPAGYETGYTANPVKTGESVPLSEVNLDPMNDVSRPPRYNPEIDPPLSQEDALAAVTSTLQAHHMDTKAFKQQFEEEQLAGDSMLRHIAVPGLPPPDQLEPVDAGPPPILHENTLAEMEAGRAALAAYAGRGAQEHQAGRKAIENRDTAKPHSPE